MRYRLLAINDKASHCDHCGKTRLKRVVWLQKTDADGYFGGEPVPFGTTCAAHALRGYRGPKPSYARAQRDLEGAVRETAWQFIQEARRQPHGEPKAELNPKVQGYPLAPPVRYRVPGSRVHGMTPADARCEHNIAVAIDLGAQEGFALPLYLWRLIYN